MRAGGMYVIEDVRCSFYEQYGGSEHPGPGTALGLLDDLVRSAQRGGRPPDAVAAVHVYPGIAFVEKLNR
jgi:hypothetical protein